MRMGCVQRAWPRLARGVSSEPSRAGALPRPLKCRRRARVPRLPLRLGSRPCVFLSGRVTVAPRETALGGLHPQVQTYPIARRFDRIIRARPHRTYARRATGAWGAPGIQEVRSRHRERRDGGPARRCSPVVPPIWPERGRGGRWGIARRPRRPALDHCLAIAGPGFAGGQSLPRRSLHGECPPAWHAVVSAAGDRGRARRRSCRACVWILDVGVLISIKTKSEIYLK